MRTKIIILFCFTLIGALFFNSCKKYEDGPGFSLSSKKSRVVNTWKFGKVYEVATGRDRTSDYNNGFLEFKRDGTYIWAHSSYSETGTWVFASNKENIVLTENSSSGADTYQIRRLTGKEFWIRESGSYSYEYQLYPK